LTIKEVFGFSIKYDNYEFPFPDEVIQEARLANFFIRAPEEIIDNELYISHLDNGICSHLAIRMNPFKLSFGVCNSSLSWEPDSTDKAVY